MAATVNTHPTLTVGAPSTLFRTPIDPGTMMATYQYAVHPDGKRFVIVAPMSDVPQPVNVILELAVAVEAVAKAHGGERVRVEWCAGSLQGRDRCFEDRSLRGRGLVAARDRPARGWLKFARVGATGATMTGHRKTVWQRAPLALRVAPVIVLCLLSTATVPVLAQAPAKGTEILWDRYGVPHIFAPDHPSLFYAYGYAQMEAHSELLLRLYAQARGRGAEYYGETYLDVRSLGAHQRHSRDGQEVGRRTERRSSDR